MTRSPASCFSEGGRFRLAPRPAPGARRREAPIPDPARRRASAIAGDTDAAARLWEESLAAFERLGDDHGRAVLLHRLGSVALSKGDFERARTLVSESHRLHDRNEVPVERTFGLMQTTGVLGAIARDTGELEQAAALIEESAAMARELEIPWWEGGMLAELACLDLRAARFGRAEELAREALAIADRIGDRPGRILGVGLLAAVAAARGDTERAARLWSAVAAEDALAPLGGWHHHRATCASLIASACPPSDAPRLDLNNAAALALDAPAPAVTS